MIVWIVYEGHYFQEKYLHSICRTKKLAETRIREAGFKWDSGQGFFCNEKARLYRKIHPEQVIEERHETVSRKR